jgi:hypothetical protein
MRSNDRYGSERGRIGRGSGSDSQDRRALSRAESPPRQPRRRPLLRPDRRWPRLRRRRRLCPRSALGWRKRQAQDSPTRQKRFCSYRDPPPTTLTIDNTKKRPSFRNSTYNMFIVPFLPAGSLRRLNHSAPSRAIAHQLAIGIRGDYANVLPSALACFEDDFPPCSHEARRLRVEAARPTSRCAPGAGFKPNSQRADLIRPTAPHKKDPRAGSFRYGGRHYPGIRGAASSGISSRGHVQ